MRKKITSEDVQQPDNINTIGQVPEIEEQMMIPKPVIGKEKIEKAQKLLSDYQKGKNNLEIRVIENEQWWKMRHWEQIRKSDKKDEKDPEPASAWLFNSVANKHADAMDNFPEPNVLPREEGDKKDAKILSEILPVILERNQFEQTYSDTWWYKLKSGTGIYGVFWNNRLENGIGDIDIKQIDILNIFWEPGIKDIQDSSNVFVVNLVNNEILQNQYPNLEIKAGNGFDFNLKKYEYDDTVDTSQKTPVIDWYYKRTIMDEFGAPRDILHYCKFCSGEVLFASENPQESEDPQEDVPDYSDGWYKHGKYPFVFDTLFPEEGTPCGFGYIDVMKDSQMYIDKLNQIILRHAFDAQNNRWFAADGLGVNMEEFNDPTKKVIHVAGDISDRSLKQFVINPIDNFIVNHLTNKIDELKETSGNRDFSQGGTTSGVTAASAIAALQEAGSKLSRDMNKSSYRAFTDINYFSIELIRQFYTEPRMFRVVGENGSTEFLSYNNTGIVPQAIVGPGIENSYRVPIFDIKIRSQKSSPFSKIAQNELALQLYGQGAFNPQIADQTTILLDMMDFEGKDMVIQKVSMNKQMYGLLQSMMPLARMLDMQNGTNLSVSIAQVLGIQVPQLGQASSGLLETNPLGDAVQSLNNNTATKAQEKASNVASVK